MSMETLGPRFTVTPYADSRTGATGWRVTSMELASTRKAAIEACRLANRAAELCRLAERLLAAGTPIARAQALANLRGELAYLATGSHADWLAAREPAAPTPHDSLAGA